MSVIHFAYIIFLMLYMGKACTKVLDPNEMVIVILSQQEGYHIAHADMLRRSILEQADILDKDPPEIVLSHELNVNGSWTIIPLLEYLSSTYATSKWFLFCLENTVIRLSKLLAILSKFNESKNLWIGHALYDHEPTIIHHFAEHNKKFKYPHVASGFAITITLLTSLVQKMIEGERPKDDFSIDASYEFASFVLKVDRGVRLTHVSEICIVSSSDCATYPRFFHACGSSVLSENVYFAVKTCAKYHVERIPVIRKTWAEYTTNIGYYSDVADKYLPEAFVVPNTTQGHCEKTYNILIEADKILKKRNLNWLVISDDDTIFSVARLLRLLTCYNSNTPIAIGERYGFRIWDSFYGYDYLTGGAGVVLSAPLVHEMIQSGKCRCPSATTPDDMYLFGICLAQIGANPIHSSLFHQARPTDYATAYLASQEPVSFHKFWMIDPYTVYDEWFAEADKSLITVKKHTEL
ncbi:beta-1,3-glucosyltransferase [Osmia lignaria lignaria]|uniref:beta-1,3-glucosyltransferase n=1 Tax=Osmia lignaria TaxID=473952 RepID=UPI001478C035|nr:beta-1,3-glucosyltransferase [Osmia lignaria]XP_034189037.1 beta-1,3-glucosyltransferase [Osmia lignaria]XP_034189038.1 beta-1,3-glucosyltransferase [Osmia lignaria]XP_034189039.1 beta-1,3-glucosyltransferase [Osmia lignaria]